MLTSSATTLTDKTKGFQKVSEPTKFETHWNPPFWARKTSKKTANFHFSALAICNKGTGWMYPQWGNAAFKNCKKKTQISLQQLIYAN